MTSVFEKRLKRFVVGVVFDIVCVNYCVDREVMCIHILSNHQDYFAETIINITSIGMYSLRKTNELGGIIVLKSNK